MPQDRLTGEQRRYVAMLARGMTAEQIAAAVGVGVATVRGQLAQARIRLDAHTMAQLVFNWIAVAAGLTPDRLADALERSRLFREPALTG